MTHTELEIERFSILIQSFCDELIKSVHDAGGDPDYLESWPEKMIDDLKASFLDAEERADLKRLFKPLTRPSKSIRPVSEAIHAAI